MSVLDSGKCQFIDGISLEESEDKVFNINAPVIARMKKKEDLIDFAGPDCKRTSQFFTKRSEKVADSSWSLQYGRR